MLRVNEATSKPIICRKTQGKILREGAVYYRYRGETKEIRYAELASILDHEKDKEKKLWMDHIQKIGSVGPANIHILDTANGLMNIGTSSVLIDNSVIEQIKFIREGHFVEKEGAPALKLIGEVAGVLNQDRIIYAESSYPYTAAHILAECGINNYEFQAFDWKYKVKGNPKFHIIIKTGRKSEIHKYSKGVVEKIRAEIRKDPDVVNITKEAYSKSKKKS